MQHERFNHHLFQALTQAGLEPLKFRAVRAEDHSPKGLVPLLKPVVEAGNDVRHSAPICIYAARAERGD